VTPIKIRGNLTMTKEIAISLLSNKDVYLAQQGKAILKAIIHNKTLVTSVQ